jgi:two-component system, cell cycle response regulator
MDILIAEDDALSRLLLQRAIERLGHRCGVTADGLEAWERIQAGPPDVIISDWMMPGLSGPDLCRRIRAHEAGYTYFILLTSNTEKEQRLEGMRAGADDYLTKPLDTDDLQLRLIAAERVTHLHRRLQAQQAELEALNESLYLEGRRDPLTGIPNRLQLMDDLDQAQARVARDGTRFCVALFDVDHFKAFNDALGHLAGDEALRQVAQALARVSRRDDRVYRYGGEEFCALFRGADLEGARGAAERMRQAVATLELTHPGSSVGPHVTVSAGVAEHVGCAELSFEEVLNRADEALYASKEAGRNRTSAWVPPELRKTA